MRRRAATKLDPRPPPPPPPPRVHLRPSPMRGRAGGKVERACHGMISPRRDRACARGRPMSHGDYLRRRARPSMGFARRARARARVARYLFTSKWNFPTWSELVPQIKEILRRRWPINKTYCQALRARPRWPPARRLATSGEALVVPRSLSIERASERGVARGDTSGTCEHRAAVRPRRCGREGGRGGSKLYRRFHYARVHAGELTVDKSARCARRHRGSAEYAETRQYARERPESCRESRNVIWRRARARLASAANQTLSPAEIHPQDTAPYESIKLIISTAGNVLRGTRRLSLRTRLACVSPILPTGRGGRRREAGGGGGAGETITSTEGGELRGLIGRRFL